jgi:hypothetical protein
MRIGIEINGVLRNTIGKIEQVYKKYMIDKTEGIEDDNSFNYEMNLPVKSLNLREHFTFKDDEEFFSFLYEEFAMEIFGHAGSTETMTFNDFNDFYLKLREKNDIVIVSDEIGKSKPASLFFLSKFGCLAEKIKFYSNSTINSMWNEIDILLTSNPDLLLNHPNNKTVIKFLTEYNKEINSEFEITSIKELKDKITQINQDDV